MPKLKILPARYYLTRSGRFARIYAIDGPSGSEIHGAIWHEDSRGWEAIDWSRSGAFAVIGQKESLLDLVETRAPEELPNEARSLLFEDGLQFLKHVDTHSFCPYCGHITAGPCCGENHCKRHYYIKELDAFVDAFDGTLHNESNQDTMEVET